MRIFGSPAQLASITRRSANRSASHTALVKATRLALGHEPDLVLWQLNQGHTEDVSGRHYQTGCVRGFSDLFGILLLRIGRQRHEIGRFVALEAKTGKARLSTEQELFATLVLSMGGFHAVIHSVDEAFAAIDRARRGLSE